MRALLVAIAVAVAAAGCASVKDGEHEFETSAVEYMAGDTRLVGHLAVPLDADGPRPAVLVIHEWWGRGAHSDHSADELARMGYVALAVDMFGDGKLTKEAKVAGEWAGAIKNDPATGIARLTAAIDLLKARRDVDPSRMACIGYCFGGTMSLEAAWAGLPLRGVVSFHGGLTTPKPEQAPDVKASILVCHGADDSFVPSDTIEAFEESMRENKLDWEFASFGGAVHSFTNPEADGSFSPVVKYHPLAAARSWELMRVFLAERFR
jgi:dienelactone hydrolase